MKLENCRGLNLINHLNQKNISFCLEQYPYLSKQDLEDQKENIVEEEVSTLSSPEYYTVIKFSENYFEVSYANREQESFKKMNLWRTKFTLNNQKYYGLGKSKKNSLMDVLNQIEDKIKVFY